MENRERTLESPYNQDAENEAVPFSRDTIVAPLARSGMPEVIEFSGTSSPAETHDEAARDEQEDAREAVDVYLSWIEGYQQALNVVQEALATDPVAAAKYASEYKAVRARVDAASGLSDFYELADVIGGDTGLSHQAFDLAAEVDATQEAYEAWNGVARSFAESGSMNSAETVQEDQEKTSERTLGSTVLSRVMDAQPIEFEQQKQAA